MKSFVSGLIALLSIAAFSATVQAQTVDTTVADTVTTVTIDVKGITCGNDLPIITKNVNDVKGIAACEPVGKPGPTTAFKVVYNPSIASYKDVVRAVENSPSCDFPDQRPYRVKKGN